ncbi:MAG: DUF177 domain-containing protein [Thermodesulfobacteriota bacterium]
MKINLSDKGSEKLRINTYKKPGWLLTSTEVSTSRDGTFLSSDIHFDLHVSKVLEEINVRGIINFSIRSSCARCLVQVESVIEPEINLVLTPDRVPGEEEDNVDYETYIGDEIDLSNYLREIIVISIPVKILCVEECRGLCSKCGTNLNIDSCSCEDDWIDPRLSVLRNLKL